MIDIKRLRIVNIALFVVLLIALIVPLGFSGRILAAIVLVPSAALVYILIKKRSILSLNKRLVLMIMITVALLYVMLYYLSGLHFGFKDSIYRLTVKNVFNFIIPISAIIVSTEIIRSVVIAQEDTPSNILCYCSCVVTEMLICSNLPDIINFNKFMDLMGLTFFPAITANLLYHYLSRRYGIYPNAIYRLIISLYVYFIPIASGISDSLVAMINLFLPIVIYVFIDALYEKKRRYALGKKSKLTVPITVLAVAIVCSVVMVVSNQFMIGAYVIATPSMTGELNQGDTAIYERYDDQIIIEGQVIVFEKNDLVVIHRVVDIQKVNGVTRYFTKGDANDDWDAGYIHDSDIIGLVNFKIPYVGYPTLWLRSLFDE